MTENEAKNKGFTHLGKIYGVKCYVRYEDDDGCEVEGTNWIRNKLIDFYTWLDIRVVQISDGFYIEEIKEL